MKIDLKLKKGSLFYFSNSKSYQLILNIKSSSSSCESYDGKNVEHYCLDTCCSNAKLTSNGIVIKIK